MSDSHPYDIAKELRTTYVKSLADKMAQLSEAIHTKNYAVIMRLGHQLKGSGSSYGLPQVSELGARMEDAGENRMACDLGPLLAEFTILMESISDNPNESETS